MVTCNKDGHIGRGDHVEYLALADAGDLHSDVIAAVRQCVADKFGAAAALCSRFVAKECHDGYWRVSVYL